jgi:hypothetical protein
MAWRAGAWGALGIIAFASGVACSLPELPGGGQSGDTDDDSSTNGTKTEPGTTGTLECISSADCAECEYCSAGTCETDHGCYCSGLDPARGFRCQPYDCDSDEECGEGEVCEYNVCVPYVPNEPPVCDVVDVVVSESPAPEGLTRVAIADLDGDGRGEIWAYAQADDTLVALDAASGDVIGSVGTPHLVASLVRTWGNEGDGLFAVVNFADDFGAPLHTLVSVRWTDEGPQTVVGVASPGHSFAHTVDDFDGDGNAEALLAGPEGSLEVWSVDASPTLELRIETDPVAPIVPPIATISDGSSARFLLSGLFESVRFFDLDGVLLDRTFVGEDLSASVEWIVSGRPSAGVTRTLVAGSFGSATRYFVGSSDGTTSSATRTWDLPGRLHAMGFADLRGDDALEVVLATQDALTIVELDDFSVGCRSVVDVPPLWDVAFGDVDGDGRSDAVTLGVDPGITIVQAGPG